MIFHSNGNDRFTSLAWPVFLFAISLGFPLGGWIRGSFGDSVLGRLTVQDGMFLLLFLFVGLRVWHFRFTWDVWLVGLVNLGILFSILAKGSPGWSEAVIHIYLFFVYFILRNILDDPVQRRSLHFGLMLAFFVAFLSAIATKIYPVPLLPQHSLHLQGSFINGSQYGSFMLVIMVPLFATFFVKFMAKMPAGEILSFKWAYRRFLPLLCVLAPILVMFSSKRAALISMMFSLMLAIAASLFSRSIKTLSGLTSFLLLVVIIALLGNALGGERIIELEYFLSRIGSGFSQIDSQDHFFLQNIRHAWSAFLASPLFGAGYGELDFSFRGEIYEIHSTYLKWLGSGGLVTAAPGFLLVFLTCHSLFRVVRDGKEEHRKYALFLLIFFLGLVIAMVYSYLPRRREFWVVLAYLNAFSAAESSVWKSHSWKKGKDTGRE